METSPSQPEHGVSAREPKFFKIIAAHDANKLRIPDEFIQRYGHDLPKNVLLRVPDDGLWNINVIESDGETWLENGWKGFWDHHSITIGKFLVFDYNGKSVFNVDILDLSASEIECQVASFADQEKDTNVNVAAERLVPEQEDADPESDNDSVVFVDAIKSTSKKRIDKGKWKSFEKRDQEKEKTLCRKKMSDCSNPGDQMGKGKRLASGMRCISPGEKHDSGTKACSSNIQTNKSNQEKSTSGLGSRKLKRGIKDHSGDELLTETDDSGTEGSDSELDNSCCPKFVIVLEGYSRQSVPLDFAEKVGLMNAKSMTLEYPPKQRYWSVLLEKGPNRDPIRLDLAAGWSKFCKENGLVISKCYTLVFDAEKNVIQVQPVNQTEEDVPERKRKRAEVRNLRSKITKTGTGYKETSSAYRDAEAYMEANAIPNLSFVSFLQPSYVQGTRLAIPLSIVRANFHDSNNNIKLRLSDGKTWPVVCVHIDRNGYLKSGWNTFREANELKLGDACVFELDKSDKHVWNVTIFRSAAEEVIHDYTKTDLSIGLSAKRMKNV